MAPLIDCHIVLLFTEVPVFHCRCCFVAFLSHVSMGFHLILTEYLIGC